jgi:uncharacterized membrane protein
MNYKRTAQAVELAAITGMRSMSGIATVALDDELRATGAASIFNSKKVKSVVQLMALGELIYDKLPSATNRTDLLPLAARTVFGAFVGATVYSSGKKPWLIGALLGAGSAFACAKVTYEARKLLTKQGNLPDFAVAVAEDLVVIGVSLHNLQLKA